MNRIGITDVLLAIFVLWLIIWVFGGFPSPAELWDFIQQARDVNAP